MLFLVSSINNFERWPEFAEVFLSYLVDKPKTVLAIAHELMVWIASLSHMQRRDFISNYC